MKRKPNPEHRIDVRVFVRAKTTAAATELANKINKLIEDEIGGNFLKYRVSLTGSHVELVENLEDE